MTSATNPVGTDARRDSRSGRPNPRSAPARQWLILGVLCVAQLMIVLDSTIVNIALPSAQRDLGFSDATRQWVITAYALAFGTLLLLGGKVADILGRRRTLLLGLAGFAAISAVAGAAPDTTVLIAARGVQGAFAALLAPAALSLLSATFTDPKARAVAFGVFGAIGGGGAAVGLLLGGALTEYLSWRWTMYVNVVFAALAFAGALAYIARDVRDPAASRPRIDLPGTVTISAGLFATVYGVARAETDGWSDPATVSLLVVGVVLVAAFVVLERRVAHPLLPLRVLADRVRAGALVALLMTAIGMFAMFLFVTYYMQDSLGYSAIRSGLAFLPLTAGVVVAAATGTQLLVPRVATRILLPAGLVLSGIALLLLTRLGTTASYATDLLPAMVVFGLGTGIVFGVGISLGTLGVREEDAGVASGLVNTMQQVGGSIGIAFLSTIAASAGRNYVSDNLRVAPDSAAAQAVFDAAAAHGYSMVYWSGAAVFAVGAVFTAVCLPPGVITPDPDAMPA
jgi:EmrB/QacA subfamily drug resistance transporter